MWRFCSPREPSAPRVAPEQADPSLRIFYNDYRIISTNGKSDAVYNMLTALLVDGTPLDGIGFQAHLTLAALDDGEPHSSRVHAHAYSNYTAPPSTLTPTVHRNYRPHSQTTHGRRSVRACRHRRPHQAQPAPLRQARPRAAHHRDGRRLQPDERVRAPRSSRPACLPATKTNTPLHRSSRYAGCDCWCMGVEWDTATLAVQAQIYQKVLIACLEVRAVQERPTTAPGSLQHTD